MPPYSTVDYKEGTSLVHLEPSKFLRRWLNLLERGIPVNAEAKIKN
jgi:hypothetical protein